MAAPLTLAELRNLSRLHRAGVEGAEAQLRAIIDERAVDLPVLLGFPEENLARLREADAPVELLLRTIDGAARRAREHRQRAQRGRAGELAVEVGRRSTRLDDGSVELDCISLVELVGLVGGAEVHFGERGGVGATRLRALLRECRHVQTLSVRVAEHTLDIVYTTARSRGRVRLSLWMARRGDVVEIPLPEAASTSDVLVDPPCEAPSVRQRARQPHGTRRPDRTFGSRLVDAFLAAALGGAP